MDDQKSNHNLLQLHNPPSSSSSPIFNHLNITSTPPEVTEFLGFYNLQPTSCSNHPYHALQTPSSETNEQLVPTSFSLMSHNYPYMMSNEIGYGALEESAGMSESPGSVGLIDDPCQVIDSSRMMGRKRRAMNNAKGKVVESPTDVIHVRAKRGQATDSHSLAERVRRERINEKMRVLRDLVPGCYKTMGTAMMFDVIIKYVQSLQRQIEFLSMKLSAASMFYDFSSPEAEAVEALQQRGNPCETRDMEEMMMIRDERCEGIYAASADQSLHSTWPF